MYTNDEYGVGFDWAGGGHWRGTMKPGTEMASEPGWGRKVKKKGPRRVSPLGDDVALDMVEWVGRIFGTGEVRPSQRVCQEVMGQTGWMGYE